MTSHVSLLVPIGLLAAISCSGAMAQATGRRVLQQTGVKAGETSAGSSRISSQWATRFPAPVRSSQVGTGQAQASPVQTSPVQPAAHQDYLTLAQPNDVGRLTPLASGLGSPAHRILQAPTQVGTSQAASSNHSPHGHFPHPPRLGLRRRIQPPPATLPNANRSTTWKTPYSYGYFGASGKRQWSLSHGYRDIYTQWGLR